MKKRAGRGGYTYYCDDDAIRAYLGLSAAMKLRWLEEANRFVYKASSTRTRKIRERFRRGEV